jgi:four helix bundle protein
MLLTYNLKYFVMASVKNFEEMDVWKKSRLMVKMIYLITNQPGFSRDWQLANHLRKTAISIVSNISEGFERDGNREFVNFLSIAKGSCGELRSQLYIALDLNYIDENQFLEISNLATEISKSLKGLMNYLHNSDFKGIKNKK